MATCVYCDADVPEEGDICKTCSDNMLGNFAKIEHIKEKAKITNGTPLKNPVVPASEIEDTDEEL